MNRNRKRRKLYLRDATGSVPRTTMWRWENEHEADAGPSISESQEEQEEASGHYPSSHHEGDDPIPLPVAMGGDDVEERTHMGESSDNEHVNDRNMSTDDDDDDDDENQVEQDQSLHNDDESISRQSDDHQLESTYNEDHVWAKNDVENTDQEVSH